MQEITEILRAIPNKHIREENAEFQQLMGGQPRSKNSRQRLTHANLAYAKLNRRAMHPIACAVAALVVLAPQIGAQCPKSEPSETEYEKVTLTETSEAAPGIAAFEGSFYLAWTGTDGRLNLVRSSDGLHFQDKITLSERSQHMASPSLTVFEGKLYLAWNGADQHLNVISSSDGRSFGNKVTLGETSYVGPVVAAYGGKLYLAWTGTNRFVNVISSSNGTNFRDKVTLSETATDSPALAAFQGKLYLAWAQSLGG
jgi:hypothetical protein